MTSIQRLDQREAMRHARFLLGQAQDKLSDAIDTLHDTGLEELIGAIASDFGGVAATRAILRLRMLEEYGPQETPPSECGNTYHLDHLRKHGVCATCGERSE